VDSYKYSIDSCEVKPFFVEGKTFTQLSDHYGVASCVHITQE